MTAIVYLLTFNLIFQSMRFKCEYLMETNGINECIKRKAVYKSKQFLTFEELDSDINNSNDTIVLGIFRNRRQSIDIQKQFFKSADNLGDFIQFRHLYTDSVPNAFNYELIRNLIDYSLPYILIIRPKLLWNRFETKFVVYSFGEINDFIRDNFYGLVGLRTRQIFEQNIELPVINIYLDIDYENQLKNTIDFRNKILELADNHREIDFIISDVKVFSEELKSVFDSKSLQQILDSVPIVTAQDINQKQFLLEDKNISIERLRKFVWDFKQQIPESDLNSSDNPSRKYVKEVSAQEFDDHVFNSGKESLIMFYTKECDYCKRLDKVIEKLGKSLENEPNVQILKQEFIFEYFGDQFKAEKFPTFFWFDKNKQKVLYYGRHEFNDFIQFIAGNSIDELQGYNRLGHLKHTKYEL